MHSLEDCRRQTTIQSQLKIQASKMTEEPEGLWTSLHSKADDRWQTTARQIQLKIQATLHEGSDSLLF